jgi:MFS family permease
VTGGGRWTLIAVVSVAAATVVVDATVVNLALPTIASALRMTSGLTQWVHEAFTLVFAAMLLYCGQLGDRIGRRRLLLLGALVLAASSALAAAAGGSGVLLLARALQGLAAAMIFPTTLSILGSTFQGKDRATAFAVWGGTIGASAGLGAVLGGWLTTSFSWRAVFAVFVPIALALVVATRLVIPENRGSGRSRGVDILGTVLSVVAMGLAVLAVTQCPRWGFWTPGAEVSGWPVSPVPLLLAGAVVIGFVLVKRQRRYPKHRMRLPLDLSPLTITSFRNGTFVAAAVSLSEFGLMFALPFWWQNALGHSAAETAALVVIPTVTALAAAGLGGLGVPRFGALVVVRTGLTCEVVAMGGLAAVMSSTRSFGTVGMFLALYGVGLGLASAQLGSLVLGGVPEKSAGAASGTMTTAQQLGAAMGVAVMGLVLLTTLKADLLARLADLGLPADRAHALAAQVGDSTGGAISSLAAQPATAMAAEAARASLSMGVALALAVAALILASALVATRVLVAGPAGSPEPLTADALEPLPADSPEPLAAPGGPVGAPDRPVIPGRVAFPRRSAPAGWVGSGQPVQHPGGRPVAAPRWYADPAVTRPLFDHP